jgi:hypothetical protein
LPLPPEAGHNLVLNFDKLLSRRAGSASGGKHMGKFWGQSWESNPTTFKEKLSSTYRMLDLSKPAMPMNLGYRFSFG